MIDQMDGDGLVPKFETPTFTCLVKGTLFCHVFYYYGLEFALAVLLVEQVGQPGGFGCISTSTPHLVAGLDELVGNMACNEAIGAHNKHSGARGDNRRLAIEVGRHDGRSIGGSEWYSTNGWECNGDIESNKFLLRRRLERTR